MIRNTRPLAVRSPRFAGLASGDELPGSALTTPTVRPWQFTPSAPGTCFRDDDHGPIAASIHAARRMEKLTETARGGKMPKKTCNTAVHHADGECPPVRTTSIRVAQSNVPCHPRTASTHPTHHNHPAAGFDRQFRITQETSPPPIPQIARENPRIGGTRSGGRTSKQSGATRSKIRKKREDEVFA